MSIAINCPTCGKSYNLTDTLAGKKVRCKQCADTFLVAGDVPPAAPAAAEGFKSEPGPRPAVEVALDTDDDLPAVEAVAAGPKEAPKSKRGLIILGVGGGALAAVACVALLICAGVLGGAYFVGRKIRTSAEESASNLPQGSGAPFTPAPKTVRDAVADLQSGDRNRKRQGADWLAKAPVNVAEQPQVARALEPLLNDFDPGVKNAAANALATWATAENVPALVKCVESNDRQASDAATRALVRLKDQRAAAALAAQLTDWGRRQNAANALQSIGRACEGEVVKYAFHPDQATRDQALRLLRGYGTGDAVILTQALAELKANDAGRRAAAAGWLATLPADEKRRAEVSAALEPLLTDRDGKVMAGAAKAAKVWGTRDNVPSLVKLVTDTARPFTWGEHTWAAMETLIALKDERGYWPIAQWVNHPFEAERGKKYLTMIGAAAEPEVAKHLADPDVNARRAAWKALGVVGTKANAPTYQAAALQEKDGFAKNIAQEALRVIAARP